MAKQVTTTYSVALPSKRDRRRAARVKAAFDGEALIRVCEMDEREFADYYQMSKWDCDQRWPADQFYFKDNGSDILAVAHLDTVVDPIDRAAFITDSADGPVVLSGGLDDRLGAYIILELLPKLGLKFDWLLTLGEETGQSTAEFFAPGPDGPVDREYKWMIEFDRGGTDVVMYEFETAYIARLVRNCGARVGKGSFSDIAYLEHLGRKGFNWGVGYEDYHGPRGHAFLDDTLSMVTKFLRFHATNKNTTLPHKKRPAGKHYSYGGGGSYGGWKGYSQKWGDGHWWGDEEWEARKKQDEADAEHAKKDVVDVESDVVTDIFSGIPPEGAAESIDDETHPWDRDNEHPAAIELGRGRTR
jgi:hypothetical protein